MSSQAGPRSLAYSKHSNQAIRMLPYTPVPYPNSPPAGAASSASNMIASEDSIAAANASTDTDKVSSYTAPNSPMSRKEYLGKETEMHTAALCRTISGTMASTRTFLQLIRKSLQHENLDSTMALHHLWTELEELFVMANETKALPIGALERQRDGTSLYHSSAMDGTIHHLHGALGNSQENADIQSRFNIQTHTQEESGNIEKQNIDRLKADLEVKTKALRHEVQKNSDLSATVAELRHAEHVAKLDAEKVGKQLIAMKEKMKDQSATYMNASTTLKKQAKTIETLESDSSRLERENTELTKLNATLSSKNSNLEKQVEDSNTQLGLIKDNKSKADATIEGLKAKVQSLERNLGDLETEKNSLLAKQIELNKARPTVQLFMGGKPQVRPDSSETKTEISAPVEKNYLNTVTDGERVALESMIKDLEEQKTALEAKVQTWSDLATRSYSAYKGMLLKADDAKKLGAENVKKDIMIKDLELKLCAARASQSNSGERGDDAAYWKDKYDTLLSSFDD